MRFARPSRAFVFLFALALGSTACASGGGGGTSGPKRGGPNKITVEELATMEQFDLYTAISRLRPRWLRAGSRGDLPAVVMNGTPQNGGLEVLRSIRPSDVGSLEFMSASDATTRFGTGYQGGAIVVSTGR